MLRWEVDEVETVAVISGAVEKSSSILVELDGLSGQDCLEAGVAELTEGEEGMSEVREDVALTSCQGKIGERKESGMGGLHLVAVWETDLQAVGYRLFVRAWTRGSEKMAGTARVCYGTREAENIVT